MHDWQSDEFSLGAYSYGLAGGSQASAQLALPLADTLFFAGEATHAEGRSATVDGAIATGYRAAAEVLASLGAIEQSSDANHLSQLRPSGR